MNGNVGVANCGISLSTAFTYQGELQIENTQVSDVYDFEYSLWDTETAGIQVGSTLSEENIAASKGRYTIHLESGDVFDGNRRYLEIAVRSSDSSDAYTVLSPRQLLAATPYVLRVERVPWSGLEDVPEGFNDGIDYNTIYRAGQSLQMNSTELTITRLPLISYRYGPASASSSELHVVHCSDRFCQPFLRRR